MKRYRIKETGVIVDKPLGLHCYYIGAESYTPEDIKNLGLTLEEIKPEVRKLYAHRIQASPSGTFIRFSESDFEDEGTGVERAPEYDITYPEETK